MNLAASPLPVRRVVVVGVGNELMGDDGAGPLVLRRLGRRWRAHPRVALHALAGDLLGLGDLAANAAPLIVIDAALDVPVGEVRLRERPQADRLAASPHHADVATTLCMLEQLGLLEAAPPWLLVSIGIRQPRELTRELSPAVARALPRATALVAGLLRRFTSIVRTPEAAS